MRHVLRACAVLVATVLLPAALLGQSKPNLSGEWTMVAEKSDFGPLPKPTSMTRTITHKADVLKIVTVQSGGPLGDTTVETTFTTDGKPQQNTVSGTPMTTTGGWDGNVVVFRGVLKQEGVDVNVDDRYELSADGRTLTITRRFMAPPDTDFTVKIVMTKKA